MEAYLEKENKTKTGESRSRKNVSGVRKQPRLIESYSLPGNRMHKQWKHSRNAADHFQELSQAATVQPGYQYAVLSTVT